MRPALYCRLTSNALRLISSALSIPHHHRIPISPVPVRRSDPLITLRLTLRHRQIAHHTSIRSSPAPVLGPRFYNPLVYDPEPLAAILADPTHRRQHPAQFVRIPHRIPRDLGRQDAGYRVAVHLHVAGGRVDAAALAVAQVQVLFPMCRKTPMPVEYELTVGNVVTQ